MLVIARYILPRAVSTFNGSDPHCMLICSRQRKTSCKGQNLQGGLEPWQRCTHAESDWSLGAVLACSTKGTSTRTAFRTALCNTEALRKCPTHESPLLPGTAGVESTEHYNPRDLDSYYHQPGENSSGETRPGPLPKQWN